MCDALQSFVTFDTLRLQVSDLVDYAKAHALLPRLSGMLVMMMVMIMMIAVLVVVVAVVVVLV